MRGREGEAAGGIVELKWVGEDMGNALLTRQEKAVGRLCGVRQRQ